MKKLIAAGVGGVLLVSVIGGVSLHTFTGGGTKAPPNPVPPGKRAAPPNAPRHFYATSALPGPLTKVGAELRVLGRPGVVAAPAAIRPSITGVGVGGLTRQNTHASCYLNLSKTARHCELTVRAGAKPWVEVQYRVDAGGVHYLSHIYWA